MTWEVLKNLDIKGDGLKLRLGATPGSDYDIEYDGTALVFNEDGRDVDFRIEAVGETKAFEIIGSTARVFFTNKVYRFTEEANVRFFTIKAEAGEIGAAFIADTTDASKKKLALLAASAWVGFEFDESGYFTIGSESKDQVGQGGADLRLIVRGSDGSVEVPEDLQRFKFGRSLSAHMWYKGIAIGTVNATPTAGGINYVVDQILTVTEGIDGTVKVTSVSGGAVTGIVFNTAGSGYTTGAGKATVRAPGDAGSGCTIEILTVTGFQGLVLSPREVGTGSVIIGVGAAGVDYRLLFDGETNDGILDWMEDEDYFLYSDDIAFADAEFLIFDKASGNGIKVDTTTPTFGWRDLEGFEIPDPTGGDRPTLSTYSGGLIKENAFSNGDVLRIRYHIPHDYVKGTDIFCHIHWSHNGTAISGNVVFGVTSDFAKGHNQANFGTEKSISITYATTDISTTPRYRHRIEESAITNDGGSATLIDRGLLEPDGIILVTFEVTTNPTITGGSPNNVFVHRADLHYQSTNIATKDKVPDFYA